MNNNNNSSSNSSENKNRSTTNYAHLGQPKRSILLLMVGFLQQHNSFAGITCLLTNKMLFSPSSFLLNQTD